MFIPRTYTPYVIVLFGRKNSGWMGLWGLNPERPARLCWKALAIWKRGEGKEHFICLKPTVIGREDEGCDPYVFTP